MSTTYLHAVASLDGYIADERDEVGPLHDWYFNGDHPLVAGRSVPRCDERFGGGEGCSDPLGSGHAVT